MRAITQMWIDKSIDLVCLLSLSSDLSGIGFYPILFMTLLYNHVIT